MTPDETDTLGMASTASSLAVSSAGVAALLLLLGGCATPAPMTASQGQALACALPSNCVDTLGVGGLEPLKYRCSAEQALARLEATLRTFPEAQVAHREALALRVIFTTPMGFRDQVDFLIDAGAESIDFRSRSLLGLFDFGKNRCRMQEFAQRFKVAG